MFKTTLRQTTLVLLLLLGSGAAILIAQSRGGNPQAETGTLERLAATNGIVAMNLDWSRVQSAAIKGGQAEALRFEVGPNSLFTILAFNGDLRGPEQSAMELVPKNAARARGPLQTSINQLVIEKVGPGEASDLVVRDAKTGAIYFRVEGNVYAYDAHSHVLRIDNGRLLLSGEFAKKLGSPAAAHVAVGTVSVLATMSPMEITHVVNGVVQSDVLPARALRGPNSPEAFNPGPDVIVGDLPALQQFGSSGTQVGLAVGTTSCNIGDQPLDWFALSETDHPVIPQNLYRMSGGTGNDERFEQIGQSWLKHAFYALENSVCSVCTPTHSNGRYLGVGCSDPYSVSLNASQSGLGSRAWVNPFTGAFPSTANDHTGHTHTGVSHRIAVEKSDLTTSGASYYAESQYVTPHEYAWCQAHQGECNMYNNASYRRFNVTGTTSFTFSAVGATVRMSPAIMAWTGATVNQFEPAPGADGIGFVAYKVTNPSAGVWHYEYAVLNENLDRSVQSFSVPLDCGVTATNLGFHAPSNPPAFANDGTPGSTGFSNAAWTSSATTSDITWSSETFAQNENANAIRWGTMYNFRFDSSRPPQAANATIGFFKTGSPITVAIMAPSPDTCNALALTTAVSRKTHGGAGSFDINLPLTGAPGIECRSGGTGGNYTMVFTFTNDVASGNASVTTGTGGLAGSPSFSGNTMTVNLTGVANKQTVTVTLTNLMDTFGQTLANTSVSANMLIGDTSASNDVNNIDISQTKSRSGVSADSSNFRSDVTLDGEINGIDVSAVKAHSGESL